MPPTDSFFLFCLRCDDIIFGGMDVMLDAVHTTTELSLLPIGMFSNKRLIDHLGRFVRRGQRRLLRKVDTMTCR